MGFESFLVRLSGGNASFSQIETTLQQLEHVVPQDQSLSQEGESHYRFDDGNHIIEIEILDRPSSISCRFTLCHPKSIDRCFLNLVKVLIQRLSLQAEMCDAHDPNRSHIYGPDEFGEFEQATLRCIDCERRLWISMMGPDTAAATTAQAFERFILPRCEPVVNSNRSAS